MVAGFIAVSVPPVMRVGRDIRMHIHGNIMGHVPHIMPKTDEREDELADQNGAADHRTQDKNGGHCRSSAKEREESPTVIRSATLILA